MESPEASAVTRRPSASPQLWGTLLWFSPFLTQQTQGTLGSDLVARTLKNHTGVWIPAFLSSRTSVKFNPGIFDHLGQLLKEMAPHSRMKHAYKNFCMFTSGAPDCMYDSKASIRSSVGGGAHAHCGGLLFILLRQLGEVHERTILT